MALNDGCKGDQGRYRLNFRIVLECGPSFSPKEGARRVRALSNSGYLGLGVGNPVCKEVDDFVVAK